MSYQRLDEDAKSFPFAKRLKRRPSVLMQHPSHKITFLLLYLERHICKAVTIVNAGGAFRSDEIGSSPSEVVLSRVLIYSVGARARD